jgi:hypothetical protein
MPHYIEEDESTAKPADVVNQSGELGLGQVMTEVHRERHIGARKRITYGIGLDDRNAHIKRFTRVQIDSDHFDSKLAADLLSDETIGAPYIENAANGQWISADRANDEGRTAVQSVNPGKLPVRSRCLIIRNVFTVEYFSFVLTHHQQHLHKLLRSIERAREQLFF